MGEQAQGEPKEPASRDTDLVRTTASVMGAYPAASHADQDTERTEPASVRTEGRWPALIVLAGPDEGQVHKLRAGASHVIGRAADAQIAVGDDGVSRNHARLCVGGDGDETTIEDLGSHNGTWIGRQRVERGVLRPDDLIRVGAATIMKFCYIDPVEEQFRFRLLAATLRDPLTGVYNRRHYDECLAAECAAARRHTRSLALLLIDVDEFKKINEEAGHPVGDNVLRAVAHTLMDSVRREDLVFRHGGDEFAVLAREATGPGACELGERIRRRVSRRHFGGVANTSAMALTVSVGIAVLAPDEPEAALIGRAEAALAQAKREGRDRVLAA